MSSTSSIAYINTKERNPAFVVAQIVLSSLLIALCAQISIHLPFTPVPVTMQTLAVMMVGGMLGSRNGAISVLLYLVESMLGLPVLAGGTVNPLALVGPTGGYLIGFVFQAYLVGWFAERIHVLGKPALMIGVSLAYAMELAIGALWLSQFVGLKHMLMMGVIPFIPGAIVKILVVVNFLTRNDNRAEY